MPAEKRDDVVKILIVEDRPEDAEFDKREANKVLTCCEFRVVETREDFLHELETFQPDLVLSDYSMPTFDGLTALQLSLDHNPVTPVIIVTGSVNEETAVECMKAGASNYVIKEQMRRLGPAILHSLEEKQDKLARKQSEEALKESEERFRNYIELAPEGIFLTDSSGQFLMVNEAACRLTGYTPVELMEKNIRDLVFPEDLGTLHHNFNMVKETGQDSSEIPYRSHDGKRGVWIVKSVKLGDDRFLGFTHDITIQKNAEEALRKSEIRFRELFENAPMAYQSLDKDGNYIDMNQALCDMLGYEAQEMMGTSFGNYWDQKHRDQFPGNFNCLVTEGSIRAEVPLVSKGGEIITALLDGRTQTNNQGNFVRTHCILVDISSRKKNEAELLAAKEKAEESDRLKTAFLNNISHEVRTPLNALMGFSNLLKDSATTPADQDYYLRIINHSGERLVNVINDIISMAMLETGQEVVRESQFDLLDLMNEVFITFQARVVTFEICFNYRPGITREQSMIISDEYKIRQVLTNLIGNSLKFTTKGNVEFGCNLDDTTLTFFVKDSGIGIASEDKPHVFEKFWKSKPSGNRMYEGTGLGLAICKAYVTMLNGKVWMQSEPGSGSTFWFTIPYRQPEKQPIPGIPVTPADRSHPVRPKTILVADDEYDNFLLLEIILQKFNVGLIHVWNGMEAVEVCRNNQQIDFILMDLKMPVMDGMEATRLIKLMNPEIPIIAVTAYAMSGDETKALDGGCDWYLSKPLRKEVLLEKLRQMGLINDVLSYAPGGAHF